MAKFDNTFSKIVYKTDDYFLQFHPELQYIYFDNSDKTFVGGDGKIITVEYSSENHQEGLYDPITQEIIEQKLEYDTLKTVKNYYINLFNSLLKFASPNTIETITEYKLKPQHKNMVKTAVLIGDSFFDKKHYTLTKKILGNNFQYLVQDSAIYFFNADKSKIIIISLMMFTADDIIQFYDKI